MIDPTFCGRRFYTGRLQNIVIVACSLHAMFLPPSLLYLSDPWPAIFHFPSRLFTPLRAWFFHYLLNNNFRSGSWISLTEDRGLILPMFSDRSLFIIFKYITNRRSIAVFWRLQRPFSIHSKILRHFPVQACQFSQSICLFCTVDVGSNNIY